MKHLKNISAQQISWVKSNKDILESVAGIDNLYYPDSMEELIELIRQLNQSHGRYAIIGYSSNTLFLPSFKMDNVVCTKHLQHYDENEKYIICDCGVNISQLSAKMVNQGYVGFEGLLDLPGTIAAAVYGNCGCQGCSVNALVDHITVLLPSNEIVTLTIDDLHLSERSSALKRGEKEGVVLQVWLKKIVGDANQLKAKAEQCHQIRKLEQPSAENNLGTTFLGMHKPTSKGKLYELLLKAIIHISSKKDPRSTYKHLLFITGNKKFIPYVYYKNRYLFKDAESHIIFPEYQKFLESLYTDVSLEIEIRS